MTVKASRMFPEVTETWNPVTGCTHLCRYCWARRLASTRLKHLERYRDGFKPRLNREELGRRFKPGGFVFVSDMGDLFCSGVPDEWIELVLARIAEHPKTRFLLMTKNPARYLDFLEAVPGNALLGATIETDLDAGYSSVSKAPPPSRRLQAMIELEWHSKVISVEPVLRFTGEFPLLLAEAKPLWVYVGYDNYSCKLPEPPLSATRWLIRTLRGLGVEVREKTLRPSWRELLGGRP
ncbi:MAG: phage Gp37/Gp68 family protein [Thermofilum sp.]|nr:phage Gp37/Gp68 family protein [Thermofilum sp.]MCC6066055.1 phage Gp37/Gp68 family protein [Thermofilum sp.]